MPYDFGDSPDRSPPPGLMNRAQGPMDPLQLRDLLEITALLLTPAIGATFSEEELIAEARVVGGVPFDESAARLIIDVAPFLLREGDRLRLTGP